MIAVGCGSSEFKLRAYVLPPLLSGGVCPAPTQPLGHHLCNRDLLSTIINLPFYSVTVNR
jgi:hypothetical protein